MLKSIISTLVVVCLLVLLCGQVSVADDPAIAGEIVVKLRQSGRPGYGWQGENGQLRDSIGGSRTYLVSYPEGASIDNILGELRADPAVEFAEPNYQAQLPENFQMSISFPDERAPSLLWGVSPTDYFDNPAVYDLGLAEAHLSTQGTGITVAVIDNGLALTHPVFDNRLAADGYDFVDHDDDPSEMAGTAFGHGTFVAGLALLTAPEAMILPVRAFNGDGYGTSFAIAAAIQYAVDNGARIINMSFGMNQECQVIAYACGSAVENNLILVAASGNESLSTPVYPAAFPGVIAVSAIDENDLLASFSNYGEYIDVCAPGVNLYSALAGEYEWGTWSGTSFSTPLVSATCALVLSLSTQYGAIEMQHHLRHSAETELDWGTIIAPDMQYGYGRLNTAAAVDLVGAPSSCGDIDGNGVVNMADVNYLVRYIFKNGPEPVSMEAADVNCDGYINEADATYLSNYLNKQGVPPCCMQ